MSEPTLIGDLLNGGPAPRRTPGRIGEIADRLELESGKKLEDYPFDPNERRPDLLHGLDKLRACPPGLRERAWLLYWACEAREVSGDAARYRKARDEAYDAKEQGILLVFARGCLSGRRGETAKQLAEDLLMSNGRQREDLASLRNLMVDFLALPKSSILMSDR